MNSMLTLQDIPSKSYVWLVVLLAFGPAMVAIMLRISGGGLDGWVFWLVAAVCALTFMVLLLAMQNRHVEISGNRVGIQSSFYKSSFDMSEVTGVDMVRRGGDEDRLGIRVNGVGLPGFQSGWFIWSPRRRIFVDCAGGDYLLIHIRGEPAFALQFSDNEEAGRVLAGTRSLSKGLS